MFDLLKQSASAMRQLTKLMQRGAGSRSKDYHRDQIHNRNLSRYPVPHQSTREMARRISKAA